MTRSRRVLRPCLGEPGGDGEDGVGLTGEHDRGRAVDGGDADLVGEVRGDLRLGRLDGDHRAAVGQRLHQRAARADQQGGVGQRQTPATWAAAISPIECPVRRSGVTPHDSSSRNRRDLDREERGLRVAGLLEQFGAR